MKKILFTLMVCVLCLGLVGGAFAYFSDVETSSGNTFTAGTLDLTLDYRIGTTGDFTQIPNGTDVAMLNIGPMKPCDSGEITISMHNAGNIAGDLTVTFTSIVDNENGINEPEGAAGDITPDVGELSSQLEITVWIDNGDNIYGPGDDDIIGPVKLNTIAINTALPMGSLAGGATKYLAIAWHLQDNTLNNLVQSDSVVCGVKFDLVQP